MLRLVFAISLLVAGPALAALPPPGSTYVAMGSSYAAGTSLPREVEGGLPGCGQGTESYPRQVARSLRLTLVDRSCGGATTPHLLDGGQFGQPAQVASVDASTRLVTITVGGNDVRFVADLGRYSCARRRDDVAEAARPFACSEPPAGFALDAAFATLEADLRRLTAQIRARAPQARIVFVDYAVVVPPAGTCPALGLAEAEAALMRARAERLAALTARIARESGADLIEASALTRDHHACAAQPWVWGFVSGAERAATNAVGFHPRPQTHTAVAEAIVARLNR